MVTTEETNVISLSQWYPKYMKKIINVSNPDYQPIPKPFPYLPIISTTKIWVRETTALSVCVCYQTHYPPKKPYQVGRKSAWVTWPYPKPDRNMKGEMRTYKKTDPYHSPWVIGEKFG